MGVGVNKIMNWHLNDVSKLPEMENKLLSMRCHRMLILQGEWMTALCCKGHVTLQQHRSGGGIVLARSRLFKFLQRPLAVSWPHSGILLQHLYFGHAFGRLWDYY